MQDDLKRREAEAKFFKRKHNEIEDIVHRYKNQLTDIPGLNNLLLGINQPDVEVSEILNTWI